MDIGFFIVLGIGSLMVLDSKYQARHTNIPCSKRINPARRSVSSARRGLRSVLSMTKVIKKNGMSKIFYKNFQK